MSKFGLKGSISDEDFMIHGLNNFPNKDDIILIGLENCLMVNGNDVLTIDVIHKKLYQGHEKIKDKNEEKIEKRP